MYEDYAEAVLAGVGEQLRKLRQARHLTLSDVAEQTGLSTSTLSRLESGQRRAGLEVLLPLSALYRVPLDDLVAAPPVGDPRIFPKPRRRGDVIVVPLTQSPGAAAGVQDCHPGVAFDAGTAHARGIRVAVRAVRGAAAGCRGPRRDAQTRPGRRVAAYREQFGISTDRSLIGEPSDHGDGARAYDQITARVRDLHGATTPVAARTGDLVDRASMQQEQLRHDQQIAQERAEQGRLEETRRAERLEQIRRQQRDPKRKGPTL